MLGMGEMIAIGVIALVVIGPEKFPDFAKMCFKTMRELRGHMDDLKSEVGKEINPLKGKFNELRRIDPEKYIDQLVEGDIEDEEEDGAKDSELSRVTPEYGMDNESEDYWENDEYGINPKGGVEQAIHGDAIARDEAELRGADAETEPDGAGVYESMSVPYHEGSPESREEGEPSVEAEEPPGDEKPGG